MKNSKKILAFVLLAASVYGLGSCHRGYGCPTDLKAAASVVVKTIVSNR